MQDNRNTTKMSQENIPVFSWPTSYCKCICLQKRALDSRWFYFMCNSPRAVELLVMMNYIVKTNYPASDFSVMWCHKYFHFI